MDPVQEFIIIAPVLLFSMVAHEYAHGYAALRQGDPTAYQLGRLTWNPLKHIDPFMTVILPALTFFAGGFLFGGAKPVPVVPRNYRNYRRGDIIVSLAGIAANLVLFVVCVLLYAVFGWLGREFTGAVDTLALLQLVMDRGIFFNLLLAFFNLLPLPPLDGSHVMKHLLPPAAALRYQQVGMYGIAILMLLLITGLGRSILIYWLTPALLLQRFALDLVAPLKLIGSFTLAP